MTATATETALVYDTGMSKLTGIAVVSAMLEA
jgi:hypothetical protein